MIGYKVDYGYYTGSFSPDTWIPTDTNSILILPTLESSKPNERVQVTTETIDEAYNMGLDLLGKQIYAITGFISRYTINSSPSVARRYFPNFFNQAPNFSKVLETNANNIFPVIYFQSRDMYLVGSGTWVSPSTTLYDSSGKSLAYFPGSMSFFYYPSDIKYDGNCDVETVIFFNYKTGDVVNSSNYSHLRLALGFPKSLYDLNPASFPLLDTLYGLLFGGQKPDYIDIPTDPYQPADPSGPGNLPQGTFDFNSDIITDSPLPTLSMADTGFTRIYNPTLGQVRALASYLWTDESVVDTIWNHLKQFFEDPMQAMIGFNLVPCTVPNGGTEEFSLMYIPTGVYMTTAASQFVDVDCGTVELERVYGSALDQSPYTKVHCYLPYIGTVQIDTDEVMGRTLQVKYRIDIVSGSCVAKVFADGSILYQFSGHCAIAIPFSSASFSNYVSAAISIAKLAVGAAAGAGMAALASTAQDVAQETNRVVTRTSETAFTERNPMTGRQITTRTERTTSSVSYPPPKESSETQASFAGLSPANISNTVAQVMSSKINVQHSGSFSGNSGYLGVRRPYLIIERPNMCLPASYQSMNGYPSMITMTLGDCVGYTRVQQVQLTGMWATNPEQAEILQLLKSGVVF